ncbi:nitroreductase family deazaflavin-dependent oxidoreductase [Catenulispora sp. NF23]|uniref:Nitroreductase family deazaflavin-dependent oxidoreductase n=1 Tax=Catenulispora pinistramenti TaxID=2705254 RepID=A0ABS5KV47_9ACTN|nr:nitroreductase/quinone reductase family protein [Catenulispora pinistramenti]MBS2536647.1 nitroreductase family deazaflavin-dependent oxidoreductase [Catenulispora pinistramenti]MBS2549889.1 nitroreductase family deazaflavin-dependent oxidoreductase [Catenulispora pinistramenti]
MSNDEMRSWNDKIIEEFRANAGSVEQFGGKGLVLLHHKGAKSGTTYVSPLAGFAQGDDEWLIVASNAGRDNHPAWYYNLQANPETELEVPGDDDVQTVRVTARVAGDDERDGLFEGIVAKAPQFGEYQTGTPRRIPVVVLARA